MRLAHAGDPGSRNGVGEGVAPAALLVSYFYLTPFLKHRARWNIRDWALDSGAFSAHASGKPIDLAAYIATCQRLLAEDPQLSEVFALDVIGDWRASERNTEEMLKAGIPAIPAWHRGEPWDVLVGLARQYPKIALGGLVGMRRAGKLAIVREAFARVWQAVGPKRIHGFGLCTEELLMAVPFDSVDATSWEIGPCAFGLWKSAGNSLAGKATEKFSIRGTKQPLRAEVEWYLALECRAQARWAVEMAKWPAPSPIVRLALSGKGREGVNEALQSAPPMSVSPSRPAE